MKIKLFLTYLKSKRLLRLGSQVIRRLKLWLWTLVRLWDWRKQTADCNLKWRTQMNNKKYKIARYIHFLVTVIICVVIYSTYMGFHAVSVKTSALCHLEGNKACSEIQRRQFTAFLRYGCTHYLVWWDNSQNLDSTVLSSSGILNLHRNNCT